VSNEQTKAMQLESVRYNEGEHWSRKPLHLAGSPSFLGKASRGLIGGVWAGGELLWIGGCWEATSGDDMLSPCSALTSSLVNVVSWFSWCWCMASCEACAVSSVDNRTSTAGSLCCSLLLWLVRSVWIHLQLLLRIIRQYRVECRQGRTAGVRQRQSNTRREIGAGSKQTQSRWNNPRSGQAETNQKNRKRFKVKYTDIKHGYNAQKWQPGQIKTSQGVSVCEWLICVCVCVCVCKWGAGVDDQSVPGMRNDGKWSLNGNG